MKITICPITKKPLKCKTCKAIEGSQKCPSMVFDEANDYAVKFIRKLVEREVKRCN